MHILKKYPKNKYGDYMFTTVLRTLLLYVLVMVAMRLMGKRQIGDMQPAELVVTILISEIASIPIQDTSQPVFVSITAIFALVAFEIVVTVITMKSNFLNGITNGKSAIIIKNGKVLQPQLKKMRITIADLMELLRGQGIFDLNEVSYAVLETNGTLSVLQKPQFRNARIMDCAKVTEPDSYPSLVISDGKLLKRGLEDAETTKADIQRLLRQKHIDQNDVFIMTVDRFNNAVIIKKEN